MKFISMFAHAIMSVAVVAPATYFGYGIEAITGMAGLWIGRETAQAGYRAINTYYGGKRANMPWYGPFEPSAWSLDALVIDMLIPIIASIATYWAITQYV